MHSRDDENDPAQVAAGRRTANAAGSPRLAPSASESTSTENEQILSSPQAWFNAAIAARQQRLDQRGRPNSSRFRSLQGSPVAVNPADPSDDALR